MIAFVVQFAVGVVGLLLEGALDFLLDLLAVNAAEQNARAFEHADPSTMRAWRHFPF